MLLVFIIRGAATPDPQDGYDADCVELGLFTGLEQLRALVLDPAGPQHEELAAYIPDGDVCLGFVAYDYRPDRIGTPDVLRLAPDGSELGHRWRESWLGERFAGRDPDKLPFKVGDLVFDLDSGGRPAIIAALPPGPEDASELALDASDDVYLCLFDSTGDHAHTAGLDLLPAGGLLSNDAAEALYEALAEHQRLNPA